MSPARWTVFAGVLFLQGVFACQEGPATRYASALCMAILGLRFVLPEALGVRLSDSFRRITNTVLTVGLWVASLSVAVAPWLEPGVFLALCTLCATWFVLDRESDSGRDVLLLIELGLLAVVVFLRLDMNPVFVVATVATVAFLILATAGSLDRQRLSAGMEQNRWRTIRHPGRDTGICAALVVATCALGWLFLTRSSGGEPARSPIFARIGLTGSVRLGEFSHLKSDERLALTIALSSSSTEVGRWTGDLSPERPLLLKAQALDRFDGRGFSALPPAASSDNWVTDFRSTDYMSVHQTVTIAVPSAIQNYLVALDRAEWSTLDRGDASVEDPEGQTVRFAVPYASAKNYKVQSQILRRGRKQLQRPVVGTGPELAPCLSGPNLDKYASLARFRDAQSNPLSTAEAIERWLSESGGFRYDRNDPNDGDDPLWQFLTETRVGHCEYYASAMVMLLRSLSIPARLVVGFRGGNWSAEQGRYHVLMNNAHAWVEVPFEGVGWVSFDPTPPETRRGMAPTSAASEGPADSGVESPAVGTPDAMEADQSTLAPSESWWPLVLSGAVAVGFCLWLWVRGRTRRIAGLQNGLELRGELVRVLTQAGAHPAPASTLRETLGAARGLLEGDHRQVRSVVNLIDRQRFGQQPLTDEESAMAWQILHTVGQRVRLATPVAP